MVINDSGEGSGVPEENHGSQNVQYSFGSLPQNEN